MIRPHVAPPAFAAEPDTERDLSCSFSPSADTLPDALPELRAVDDEIEDTQPSATLPPPYDESFYDAPTLPGVHLERASTVQARPERDGQWDRVRAVVAHAVRRVFATDSA